jgi:formamidopyrimidine-DNA glycosylase
MPELPEVESVVCGLVDPLSGKAVSKATLTAPDLYRTGSRRIGTLAGRTIETVGRLGKAIVIRFLRSADVLVIHLGMTGRLSVEHPGEPPGPAVHRHAELELAGEGRLVYHDPRRFGYFWVGAGERLAETLNVGPDPFQMRIPAFRGLLERRTAPVKSVLLNQRLISGLGNIYADESLFRSGMHPRTPGEVAAAEARSLLLNIRTILRSAIRNGGTTIRDYRRADGSRGRFQGRLRVYGRHGRPCDRCGGIIERIVIGGRSSHFCPDCQRGRQRGSD